MIRWYHLVSYVLTLATLVYEATHPDVLAEAIELPLLVAALVLRVWMVWKG